MKGAPRPRPPKGQSWRCSYACSSPCSTPCVHILLTSQCHLHAAQQCHFPVSIMARSESKNWTLHRRFSQSRWAAGIKVHKLRAAVQAGGGRPECQSTAHTHHAALSAGAQLHDNPCHQPQCTLINAWLIRETRSLLWRKKDYYKFQLFFFIIPPNLRKKTVFWENYDSDEYLHLYDCSLLSRTCSSCWQTDGRRSDVVYTVTAFR